MDIDRIDEKIRKNPYDSMLRMKRDNLLIRAETPPKLRLPLIRVGFSERPDFVGEIVKAILLLPGTNPLSVGSSVSTLLSDFSQIVGSDANMEIGRAESTLWRGMRMVRILDKEYRHFG